MKKLKHLINYKILQEWGFLWFNYNSNDGTVIQYCTQRTMHTDLFFLQPIIMCLIPHPNLGSAWHIFYSIGTTSSIGEQITLFQGRIENDSNLRAILESVYPIKPTRVDIRKAQKYADEQIKKEKDAKETTD